MGMGVFHKSFNKSYMYVILGIGIILLLGSLYYSSTQAVGAVGSAHIHQDMKLYINDVPINFSAAKYQLRTQRVHFEDFNGDAIHIHATNVRLGYALNTLNIRINRKCIILDERRFCEDDTHDLQVWIQPFNGEWNLIENPNSHLLLDRERILISYGPPSSVEAQKETVTTESYKENTAVDAMKLDDLLKE